MKSFSAASDLAHIWWNQLPIPFGVERTIAPPPVAKVCCADAHVSSMLSIKAASSIIKRDTASERAASGEDDLALIPDPFLSIRDNLLYSTESIFIQEGKPSYIN